MIDPDRLTILRRNGYTERESRFLCLVGDVGGYFLRRHFSQFLGTKRGRPEAALAAKLLEKRHAKLYLGPRGIEPYHPSRRWFYRAIGSPESRNRRKRKPSAIHTRLLTLDVVLAHPDSRHLFSDRHTSLWERLGAFRMIYLTDRRWNGRAAKATFNRFMETRWPRLVSDQPSTRERILRAFRLEKRRQLRDPQEHDDRLIQELKQQLTAARYESLYGVWAQTSDQSVYDLVAPDPHELWPSGDLDVHLVGNNYRWLYPA